MKEKDGDYESLYAKMNQRGKLDTPPIRGKIRCSHGHVLRDGLCLVCKQYRMKRKNAKLKASLNG